MPIDFTALGYVEAVFPGPLPHTYRGLPRYNPDSLTWVDLTYGARALVDYHGARRAYVVRHTRAGRRAVFIYPLAT